MLQFKELKRLLPIHREKLRTLETICHTKDGTTSPVCSSTEFNCRRDVPVFFLAFKTSCISDHLPDRTASTKPTIHETELVGYLSIFLPEETTAELNVLIHPDYRRKGIFTELLRRAKSALSAIGTQEFIFVCEPSATDAATAMQTMKAEKRSSEYQMLLESSAHVSSSFQNRMPAPGSLEPPKGNPKQSPSISSGKLLEATPDDLPLLGRMNALFFGTSEEMGERFAEDSYYTPGTTVYKYVITEENKKAVPIGTVCFYEEENIGNIFGLGLLPKYRGYGFGQDLLSRLLARIPANKQIYLQVSSQNSAAFQLYQKAGFRIIAQQDFWLLP